ncbi:hypothetical protein F9H62_07690 [Vibrio alginolyticus]|nr:hypothetical protein [Vibrio alginolyticus]
MKVFTLNHDVENFSFLQETQLEISIQYSDGDLRELCGERVADTWMIIDLEWVSDNHMLTTKPDFAIWRAGEFACSESAYNQINEALDSSCEFLPLRVAGERWYAINILKTCDAIDKDRTVLNVRANGKPSRVKRFKKLVLSIKSIKSGGLFRIENNGSGVYCNDELGGLYEIYHRCQLKGLIFEAVETS